MLLYPACRAERGNVEVDRTTSPILSEVESDTVLQKAGRTVGNILIKLRTRHRIVDPTNNKLTFAADGHALVSAMKEDRGLHSVHRLTECRR